MKHVVALSGGKDSTAMALRLQELGEQDYTFFCTPTGDELPEMGEHWGRLEQLLGKPIVYLRNYSLDFWIHYFGALPNWRQRWCTRLLKIEPCLAYLKSVQPAVLYVGLRADEEQRQGIYSNDVESRFPMRDWGWALKDVRAYLERREVTVPVRTDCARCWAQRLGQWKDLMENHPKLFEKAKSQEALMGHTFRSPQRDSWPAELVQLEQEFKSGRKVPNRKANGHGACRVCSL